MIRFISLLILMTTVSLTAFAQSGGIKGKVKNEADKGLAGVELKVKVDGKIVKTGSTDSSGEFLIGGLADGMYVLSFEKDGYSSGSFRVEIKKGKIRDLSSKNFILPRDRGNMVALQGTVFDQIGFSVPGARVEVSRMTAGKSWEKLKAIYSSENGEFIFRFPASDSETTYRVTVSYKDVEPQVKEKATDVAGIYRLSFNLPVKIGGPKQTDLTKP
jgi:hypothetical protein